MNRDRPAATVLAELEEIRRHLDEAPPHQAAARGALQRRREELERELARVRREAPSGSAVTHPGVEKS